MAVDPDVPVGDPRSTSEVVQDVVAETQTLFRQEVQLARIELTEALSARVQAVAGLAVAGVLALFAVGFLAAAGASALANVLDPWLANLLVGLGFLTTACVAAVFARGRAATPVAPETTRTLKEDAAWARTQLQR